MLYLIYMMYEYRLKKKQCAILYLFDINKKINI